MKAFDELVDVIEKLRGPGGCPWDIEQTPLSIREDLLEETYECIEAIGEKDPEHIKEELGDLYLLVTLLSYMHEQEGTFTVESVLKTVCAKLIRRHPHVFNGLEVKDTAEVLDNWAKIKVEQEGRKPKDSLLDGVKHGLPPLDRAYKLQKKAAKAGFDWPDINGVYDKIEEELGEVKSAQSIAATEDDALEDELGDLLFSVVNLCHYLNVEPSFALQKTNTKFTERFRHVEKQMKERGEALEQKNLALMEKYWQESKKKNLGNKGSS